MPAALARTGTSLLQRLVATTHFSTSEVRSLLTIANKLCRTSGLNQKRFRHILHNNFGMTDLVIPDRIFRVFCRIAGVENDHLYASDLISGLSVFLRGTGEERRRFCFEVYDIDADGVIGPDDMKVLLRESLPLIADEEEKEEAMNDLLGIVADLLDADDKMHIKWESYSNAVTRDELRLEMLGQCFPKLEVSHAFNILFADNIT